MASSPKIQPVRRDNKPKEGSVRQNTVKSYQVKTEEPTVEPEKKPLIAEPEQPNHLRNMKIWGLVLGSLALVILIAGISHFFTGSKDASVAANGIIPVEEKPAFNWIGTIGAFISDWLITNGFGVSGLLIPVWMLFKSYALIENKYNKEVFYLIPTFVSAILWFSLFFSYLVTMFGFSSLNPGGMAGKFLNELLGLYIGETGVAIFLLFAALIFIVVRFNANISISGLINKISDSENVVQKKEKNIDKNENELIIEELQDSIDTSVNPKARIEEEDESSLEMVLESEESEPESESYQPALSEHEIELPEQKPELVLQVLPVIQEPEVLPLEEEKVIDQTARVELEDNLELQVNNVTRTAENVYERVVPEGEDESLGEGDVGDWELYDPTKELSSYKYPSVDLLIQYESGTKKITNEELQENTNKIVRTLKNYNIEITSISATPGPTVTLYEIIPAPGIRISKIKNLEDDIALSLSAIGIRIIAPIPGKGTIGIEIPNANPEIVSFRSVVATEKFRDTKAALPVVLGKTIANELLIADLTRMPHLLIAGATGQGKSVGINCIISSILYKKHPAEVKFVLIDPKKVEMNLYQNLERHFLAKLPGYDEAIITDTSQVINVLNSLCKEMDNRYDLLKAARVRNILEYNEKFLHRQLNPNKGHRYLPYIVLVIDELADLMIQAGKQIETPIARLAQLARAIGIHLVLATQRPSVNVITGVIKANFPARISYRVSAKVDSRTILDTSGADQLIGRGDMLVSLGNDIIRVQNSFIDTPEVERMVSFISSQRGFQTAYYLPEVEEAGGDGNDDSTELLEKDPYFEQAARLIVESQQGSTSLIQRKLKLGYNRAGRVIDQLEKAGIVGPFSGSKAREVLVKSISDLEHLLNRLD